MGFTAMKSMKLAMVGGALAATALLSACSGNNAAANGSPVKNASDASAARAGHGAAGGGGSNSDGKGSDGDVNCSAQGGQVGPPGGPRVDLIADQSTGGTIPGCTEAFNVITEYYAKAPTEGEGPGRRVLDIQGTWKCALAPEPEGSQGAVFCGKQDDPDSNIETRPSTTAGQAPSQEPARRFPNTTQNVHFTGYDTATNMARFQLIQWQAGGPDNGHYVDVPGDTKTYRLPLDARGEVFSAASLCPGDSVTVDSRNRGTTPCTPRQLQQSLATGGNMPFAEIHVDGNDRITMAKEIYHP
ncbi:hypothetical protein OG943_44855 [Amycolatopsis sp. NBC_00345]|uniref:hypothetical protein n=1 Tax=Amycolatopsis sp. NBC_00345 TaxID=2975955 RepID=UPI002E26651B